MHIPSLGSGSILYLHCANRLHQLQRPLAMAASSSTSDLASFWASVHKLDRKLDGLLLSGTPYSNPQAPQAEPAAQQAETGGPEAEQLNKTECKMMDGLSEELERNFMMAEDDRLLKQLVEAMRQPSQWLLEQMRGDGSSFLNTLD